LSALAAKACDLTFVFALAIYLPAYFTPSTLRPIFGPFYSRFLDYLLSGNIDHGKPVLKCKGPFEMSKPDGTSASNSN
jgi:hypothetical protein